MTEQAKRPLYSRRVLVTRAAGQASDLANRLQLAGASAILMPTIEIGPPTSFDALDEAMSRLEAFDLVVFTSSNGVDAFANRSKAVGLRTRPRRVAVVGTATAKAVQAIGLDVNIIPEKFTAEALAEKLRSEAAGRDFLLILAEDAPSTLEVGLQAAGGKVTVAVGYSNRVPLESVQAVQQLFASRDSWPDAATFTSASTARNLVALLERAKLRLPDEIVRASIGPVTSKAMAGLAIPPHIEAGESTITGLVDALTAYFVRQH